MARRKDNVAQIRKGIAVAVAVLVVVVVGYGLYYTFGSGGAGEPYVSLDKPDATGAVEVVEFFSYECPACRSLEALIDGWRARLPQGVVFTRVHVAYSPSNRLLAKSHRALVRSGAFEANHERLFRAIHDRNRRFATLEEVAAFVDGHGIERERFLRATSSTRSAREVDAGQRSFVALGLTSVPALVVDDKYIINMNAGRRPALAATANLVDKLLAERSSE